MLLFDVNVLINAHQPMADDHARYRDWFLNIVDRPAAFGLSELVCSSFVRIVSDARIYAAPAPIDVAVEIVEELLARPNCHRIRPGSRHFELFARLCVDTPVRGKDVADAYHAALAIESGCEWVSDDRGFARFPGLRWHRPFED